MSDLTALALGAAEDLPVAELHGAVCGLGVCCGDELPVQDLIDLVGLEALTDQQSVERFVNAAMEDLRAPEMRFSPLLPDDDAALPERVEALGQWCGSFLAGVAAGLARRGVGTLENCPEEVREIVRDFAAIAQVDAAAGGDSAAGPNESEEADLVELEEFVKVGTLLLMSTFADDGGDSPR